MKNRVLIYHEDQNQIAKCIKEMEVYMLSRGLFGVTFLTTSDFDQFKRRVISSRQKDDSNIIVLCPNNLIEEVLGSMRVAGDEMTLENEQAIKIVNLSDKVNILFIPFELDYKFFVEKFLPKKESFVCSIFGRSREHVKTKFEEYTKTKNGFNYKIITKTPYLHMVYYSQYVDHQRLVDDFRDSVYSFSNELLSETLDRILTSRSDRIGIVEYGTNGKIAYWLDYDGTALRSANNLKDFGITDEMLEKDNAGKDICFYMAKNLLKKEHNDFVLSVCDRVLGAEKSYVAVGNREVIHIYSSIFSDNSENRIRDLSHFAMFRMICFLKNQDK